MKFSNTIWTRLRWLWAGYFCCLSLASFAQGDLGSPYSVFGPGLPLQRASIHQAGMGGAGAALFDLYRINLINPAVSANHAEPIFEVGGVGQFSTFTSAAGSFENRRFVFNNISLAYPIARNRWNLQMGIAPATEVSYNFVTRNEDELIGRYRSEYTGDGGLSQAHLSTAYKLYDKQDTANNTSSLALAVQYNFFFGPIDNNRTISFEEDPTALGTAVDESFLVRDHGLEFGLHYHTNIVKRTMTNPRYVKLLFGAVYRVGNDMNAERSNYVYNFRRNAAGVTIPRDTLLSATRSSGSIHLPTSIILGAGIDFVNVKRQRLRLALDYRRETWSNYTQNFDGSERNFGFTDMEQVALGIEFVPSLSATKFLKRLEYRAGARWTQTPYDIAGTRISDRAVSAGLSLPINSVRNLTNSKFNISAEYGSYGTTDNGLIQEDYVRIMAGFSLTPHFRNRWFVKPKYD